jgi:DNA-binding NarL/FixJ family response regulator
MDDALKTIAEADELNLITVDLALPDSDVPATIAQIKNIRATRPDSLIVVVTGQDIPGLEEKVLSHGADGFVFKQAEAFTAKGFLQIVAAIAAKCLAGPTHPHRSIEMLEKVSKRLASINENPDSNPIVPRA